MKERNIAEVPSDDLQTADRDPIALVHAFAKALAEYKAHVDV